MDVIGITLSLNSAVNILENEELSKNFSVITEIILLQYHSDYREKRVATNSFLSSSFRLVIGDVLYRKMLNLHRLLLTNLFRKSLFNLICLIIVASLAYSQLSDNSDDASFPLFLLMTTTVDTLTSTFTFIKHNTRIFKATRKGTSSHLCYFLNGSVIDTKFALNIIYAVLAANFTISVGIALLVRAHQSTA